MAYMVKCNGEKVFYFTGGVTPNLQYVQYMYGTGNCTVETSVPVDDFDYTEEDITEMQAEGLVDQFNRILAGQVRLTLTRTDAKKLRTIINKSRLEELKSIDASVRERQDQRRQERELGRRLKTIVDDDELADLEWLACCIDEDSEFMVLVTTEYLVRFMESHLDQDIFTFLSELPDGLAERVVG